MAQAKNDNTALATPPMIVLPRTRVIPDDRYAGMKDRQAALAFRVLMRIGGAELSDWCEQVNRRVAATKVIEDALHREREIFLRALWTKYPAAARRIIAGLAKREGGKP